MSGQSSDESLNSQQGYGYYAYFKDPVLWIDKNVTKIRRLRNLE